jgi:hypothetical protein
VTNNRSALERQNPSSLTVWLQNGMILRRGLAVDTRKNTLICSLGENESWLPPR